MRALNKNFNGNSSFALFSVILLSLLTFNTGCDVQTAVAPRDEVKTVRSKNFPLRKSVEEFGTVRFVNNRLFLWKEDETPEQMSTVLAIDSWMDDHDILASKLNAELAQLEEKLAPLNSAMKKKNQEINSAKINIGKKAAEITKLEKLLTSLEASLKEASGGQSPDLTALEGLQNQIKDAEAKRGVLQQEKIALEAARSSAVTELAQLAEDPGLQERKKLASAREDDERIGQSKTAEITRLVDWYDSPPSSFFFSIEKDGTVQASIDDWVLEKGSEALSFTSTPVDGQKPTLVHVQYLEVGGVFLFDVLVYGDLEQTQIVETYSFRLARLKYDSVDGRIYIAGKFSRTRFNDDGSIEVRDGFAKLIDRNN
jgi:hypothetical protein